MRLTGKRPLCRRFESPTRDLPRHLVYSLLSSVSLPPVVVTRHHPLLLRVCFVRDRYLRCGADGGLYPIPRPTTVPPGGRRLEAEKTEVGINYETHMYGYI